MTRVAFFSADPLSAPPHGDKPRLLIDAELREIRAKVRAAEYRGELELDPRGAARPEDLLQTLRETHPQVVHFSGHGTNEGLILVAPDGERQHCVDAGALAEMLDDFSDDIRLVVLNACFSYAQAKSVADAVGCAIGTRNQISDRAAISFGAAFYAGIAFGESVASAFRRARRHMAVERISDRECPELVHREDVDPAEIFLTGPKSADPGFGTSGSQEGLGGGALPLLSPPPAKIQRGPSPWPRVRWMAAAVILAGGGALYTIVVDGPPPVAGCGWGVSGSVQPLVSSLGHAPSQPPSGSALVLEDAKAAEREGNDTAAFRLYKSAADAGNVEAMGFVGIAYLNGKGVAREPVTARDWLQRAAHEGDLRGMTALAKAYLAGEGGPNYRAKAREWLGKAAGRGWTDAMYRLAAFYRDTADYELALHWYKEAAEAGIVDARVDAGLIYEEGHEGVPQALDEARCLYESAAEAGSARGMFAMGRLYQLGLGVSQDYDTALKWYRKAAAEGSADAMAAIGMMFQNGFSVTRDRDSAAQWYGKAEAAGSPDAGEMLRQHGVD